MPLVYREQKGSPLTNAELDGNFRELDGDKVNAADKATSADLGIGAADKWVDAAGLKNAGITAAAISTIDGKNGGYLNDGQTVWVRNVRTVSNGHAYTPAYRVTYRDLETARFVQLFGDETVGTGFSAVLGVQISAGTGFNYAFNSTGVAYAATWSSSSDQRIKSDITIVENAVEKIQALRGCTFLKDGQKSAGVIAQELQKVLPQAVSSFGSITLKNGDIIDNCLAVDYAALACLYVEAIKELASRIEKLESGK